MLRRFRQQRDTRYTSRYATLFAADAAMLRAAMLMRCCRYDDDAADARLCRAAYAATLSLPPPLPYIRYAMPDAAD